MSNFRVFSVSILVALWLTACASDPVYVNYSHPEAAAGDWYPIPPDAKSRVEVSDPSVPKVALTESLVTDQEDTDAELDISRRMDSLGNETLLLNRGPGTAWELLDTALSALELPVSDRNRDEYRFELTLGLERRGLFSMFQSQDRLSLVLIPQGRDTLVAIEGENDEVPESDEARDILDQLLDYFQNQA